MDTENSIFFRRTPDIIEVENKDDDLRARLKLLLDGDSSQISYFDCFFFLPENRSLSRCQSKEQLLQFVLALFYNPEDFQLTFQALCVIDRLFTFPNIDLSFLGCDSFFIRCITLMSNPNKELSQLSLNTLTNFIDDNRSFFLRLKELGFISHISDVLILDHSSFSQYLIQQNLLTIFYSLLKLEPLLFSLDDMFTFWRISFSAIRSNPFSKYVRHGFTVMQRLVQHGFTPHFDDDFRDLVLSLSDSPGQVLDSMFALICNHRIEERENFFECLFANGFFHLLLNRVAKEPDIGFYVFKFFDTISYVPEQSAPIFALVAMVLDKSDFRTKVSCLKYVHTLIVERPDFALDFAGAGLLGRVGEIVEAKDASAFGECLRILLRVFGALESSRIDLLSVVGARELYESLIGLIGSADEFEATIEALISYYPDDL